MLCAKAQTDGIAAHLAVFHVGLIRNAEIEQHGDGFPAVRAGEAVLDDRDVDDGHGLVGAERTRLTEHDLVVGTEILDLLMRELDLEPRSFASTSVTPPTR